MHVEQLSIQLDNGEAVSGLFQAPAGCRACYVLAHGAGAGMSHPFLSAVAEGLGARGIATLRYQFPYMEKGLRRPDAPSAAWRAVRAAVAEANRLCPDLPLFAGGKSFGGRMTSQAQADAPLRSVCGLIFLGFPLHPARKASADRAKHLFEVEIPMLFLQGTRDALADLALMQNLAQQLGPLATLKLFRDADHSFHVPARSGRTDAETLSDVLDAAVQWLDAAVSSPANQVKL